jgi:hypothetical protein
MRKILLTLLFVSVVGACVVAIWNPVHCCAAMPELRAALASLAPTEAETKAISELRKNALTPTSVPDAAEPVDDDSVAFAIEHRFLIGKEAHVRQITANPAMSWSGLPVATQFPSVDSSPGMFSNSVSTQVPIQVRYLEQKNTEKFLLDMCQTYRMLSVFADPRFTVANGKEGTISDTTHLPFVTSVKPFVADGVMGYQPVIQFFDQGQRITTTASLLQDGSCRLKSRFELSELAKVDTYMLLDDGGPDGAPIRSGRTRIITTKSGVTVQIPTLRSFRAEIPDIVIPEGMSLLVAFPGAVLPGKGDQGVFLLITARNLSDESHVPIGAYDDTPTFSVGLKEIEDEWERFWMLDTPQK